MSFHCVPPSAVQKSLCPVSAQPVSVVSSFMDLIWPACCPAAPTQRKKVKNRERAEAKRMVCMQSSRIRNPRTCANTQLPGVDYAFSLLDTAREGMRRLNAAIIILEQEAVNCTYAETESVLIRSKLVQVLTLR